jgi:hypothetical protein
MKPHAYAIPGIEKEEQPKINKRLTQAIAEAWNIPEDKVLSCTDVDEITSPTLAHVRVKERVKVPGEREKDYVDARKFFFYVMIEIAKYRWTHLTKITGRKISYMKYCNEKAQLHMRLEKDYKEKADQVLALVENKLIDFPTVTIIIEANASIIDR